MCIIVSDIYFLVYLKREKTVKMETTIGIHSHTITWRIT